MKAKITEFGLQVKTEMLKKGLTQTWLAKEIGVSCAYLNHIFYGVSCPDTRIQQIKDVLGMN